MNIEIERKFLVKDNSWMFEEFKEVAMIWQAYIVVDDHSVIRVRTKQILGKEQYKSSMTIKSPECKMKRTEIEFEVPTPYVQELRKLEVDGFETIVKRRIKILANPYSPNNFGNVWEVDVFSGENEGLVLAEIELRDEDESFIRPKWLGKEITSDERYYNVNLSQHPYSEWKDV